MIIANRFNPNKLVIFISQTIFWQQLFSCKYAQKPHSAAFNGVIG